VLVFTGVNAKALLPGALSGVAGLVGVVTFYRAMGMGTMSIIAPIVATCSIVPVVAGVLDGERPGALQWVGVIVALAGVALASREPAGASKNANKALQLALIAALALGLSLVGLDKAAEHDSLTGVAAARLVTVPSLAILARNALPRRADIPRLSFIGLLDTSANTMFAIATTGGLLSLVAVLGGLFPVVTVALAYFLLHERLQPIQRAGVILALAGIPLIST
jgi:drug/metabolite transporter (DMT)-like permease